MEFITLLLLAFGLSMDAFAVSITNGMCSSKVTKKHALITALTFGFFQALMPFLGFTLGQTFYGFISSYSHWIALILLSAIGINMIVDSIKERKQPDVCCIQNVFSAKNLVVQGIATSIDALAAGISLAVMQINIYTAALFIGTVTFLCCGLGVFIGKKFGSLLGIRAKLFGGLILILIGLKIFIESQYLK